jgi:hypothetical protein
MALPILYTLSLLLHGLVAWRLLPALDPAWAAGLAPVLLASALLLPMGLLAHRVARGALADRLAWVGLLCMGLFSSLLVLTALRDVMLAAVWVAATLGWSPAQALLPGLRADSAVLVPLAALLVTVLGFWNARRTARVVRVDVPVAALPAALEGFTVAQITDIHVGPTIKQHYLQAIVRKVNALEADMVAITGDLVDGKVHELADHVAPLAQLRSRHGSFFVTGNHEYYSGAHAWMAELRRLGVRVLMNEHVVLQQNQAAVVLAGVADFHADRFDPSHRSDPHAAIAGAPLDAGVRLLLAHQPRSAFEAAKAGFDVQLSGHTHGGQFWPWNLFVPLQQPFTAGLRRLQDLWVYTSRGTGYWGPPKRFGAPSEITLLRLVAAQP